jgi:hypothetical protein
MIYEHVHIKTIVVATKEDTSAISKSFHNIIGRITAESEPRATTGQSFLHITFPSTVYYESRHIQIITNTALAFKHHVGLDIKKQFKEDGCREKIVSMIITAQEKHIQKITRHVSDMDRIGHLIKFKPFEYFDGLIKENQIRVK